jgi:Holliday junction resolvase|tara:strand:+ start:533 stop:946 length:414 start_codon:yes stop_codon:yes gene_type:complete
MKEARFVKLIKRNLILYKWMRIETTTMHGFPDLIGVSPQLDTVFVEAKVAKGNKIKLSPHQISMGIKLWKDTGGCSYLIVFKEHAKPLRSYSVNLYETRISLNLLENGVNEPPTAEGWHTICRYLQTVHGSRTEKPK